MGTDNRNNGNNRYNNNRTTGRNDRYTNSSSGNDTGRKSVRKVENTRFYERENPESNMRRRGRTASEFNEIGRNYTNESNVRKVNDGGDNIPEFKGFRRTHTSYETRSESNADRYEQSAGRTERRAERYHSSVERSENTRRSSREDYSAEKSASQKRNSGSLFSETESETDDSNYEFDATKEEAKARKRAAASERVNQKREDKKRRAEIIARSDDRSYRRRAVAKKKDKKIRNVQLIRAAIFIMLIFVVLLITLSKCDYDDPFGTAYVTNGSIEFMSDAKISFIREETVYKAPATGVFVVAVNEGDKVSAGTTIAYITTAEQTELIEQLQEVEEKIKTIQKLDSSSSDVMTADILAIDKELAELSRELSSMINSGKMDGYNEIKDKIDSLSSKRDSLVNNSQSDSTYLSSLIKERELIKQRISMYTQPVVASEAGVVSFNLDGSESAFSEMSKALAENSSTDLVNISSVSSAGPATNLVDKQVSAGTAVAKVITSYDYYVAAVADGNATVQSGKALSVKSKDRSYTAEIDVTSVSYSAGKTLIIGKTSKSLVSSLGSRIVDGDIITGKYEGMKIPLSSLTEFDATGTTARLTLVRSDYVVYAYVNILAKDDEYAIISDKTTFSDAVIKDEKGNVIDVEKTKGVSVNDIFVLKPEYVKEGEMIS